MNIIKLLHVDLKTVSVLLQCKLKQQKRKKDTQNQKSSSSTE